VRSDTRSTTVLWSDRNRQSLGLTQTSRQLRAEVLPLRNEVAKVWIYFHQLELYNAAFGPDLSLRSRSLIINIEQPLRRTWTFSIMPLLRLRAANPDLTVRVYTDEGSVRQGVDALLLPEDQKAWDQYWQLNVADIKITKAGYHNTMVNDLRLTMLVHPHAEETWMPVKGLGGHSEWVEEYAADVQAVQAVGKWRTRVGLGLDGDLRFVGVRCPR